MHFTVINVHRSKPTKPSCSTITSLSSLNEMILWKRSSDIWKKISNMSRTQRLSEPWAWVKFELPSSTFTSSVVLRWVEWLRWVSGSEIPALSVIYKVIAEFNAQFHRFRPTTLWSSWSTFRPPCWKWINYGRKWRSFWKKPNELRNGRNSKRNWKKQKPGNDERKCRIYFVTVTCTVSSKSSGSILGRPLTMFSRTGHYSTPRSINSLNKSEPQILPGHILADTANLKPTLSASQSQHNTIISGIENRILSNYHIS